MYLYILILYKEEVVLDWEESFKILEIEPTDDKKKIKLAYSALLKKYHPEEYPEKFMEINEAYERALDYVKNSEKRRVNEENNHIIFDYENNDFFDALGIEKDYFDTILNEKDDKRTFSQESFEEEYLAKFVETIWKNDGLTLNDWKILLKKLKEKFNKEERLWILKELEKLYDKNLNNLNLSELEKELFIYNLNSEHENTKILVLDYEKKEKKGSLENFILKYYRIKELKLFEVFLGLFVIDKKHLKDKIFYEGYKLNMTEKIKKVIYRIINIFKTFFWQSVNREFIRAKRVILNLGLENKDYIKKVEKTQIMEMILYGLTLSGLFFLRFLNMWWIFWMFATVFIGFKEIELSKKSVYYWTDVTLTRRATVISTVIFIMKMFFFKDSYYYFEIDVLLLIEYILLIIVLIIEEILLVKGRYDKIKEVTKKILDVFID